MKAQFSEPELAVMQQIWKQGRLSIREIQESFLEPDRPPYTSVQSIVYRLEEKGAVRRVRKIGNAHIFEAVTSRKQVSDSFVDNLLDLFGGRAQSVIAHLVEQGRLTRADLRETEKIIDDIERKEPAKRQAR